VTSAFCVTCFLRMHEMPWVKKTFNSLCPSPSFLPSNSYKDPSFSTKAMKWRLTLSSSFGGYTKGVSDTCQAGVFPSKPHCFGYPYFYACALDTERVLQFIKPHCILLHLLWSVLPVRQLRVPFLSRHFPREEQPSQLLTFLCSVRGSS